MAVDTPGGLIVPVLRDIAASRRRICAPPSPRKKAAAHRAHPPEDLRDFTLMLSNFGTLAGRYGIPLVVPPAVAILGAGQGARGRGGRRRRQPSRRTGGCRFR
jgi:2-oxoisovalerate dehydrogenase E2 component (dihydrolipoyl transacylase)